MIEASGVEPARLSAAQEAMLEPYREYWRHLRNSTAPADRAAAERGVAAAYAAAGLDPPARIIWCDSPIAVERSRRATWHEFDPGRLVRSAVVDDVMRRVGAWIDDHVPMRVRVGAATALEIESQYFGATATLRNALVEDASRLRWGGYARRKAIVGWLTRKQFTPHTSFQESRWLQHEATNFLAKCAFLHNECDTAAGTSALHGLWQIAANAGGAVPHAKVCWLSERHDTLALDAQGRLHSAKGPAVRYPDGWSVYAWKGVPVPGWMIEQPDQIGARLIDRERNPILRHCMIDIMTPEKYIATGAPKRFAQDGAGTLWRRQWLDWRDAWAAVEVVNGTPEPDGTRKRYFLQVPSEMRTPTEAVAWTYGMTASRYTGLVLRT